MTSTEHRVWTQSTKYRGHVFARGHHLYVDYVVIAGLHDYGRISVAAAVGCTPAFFACIIDDQDAVPTAGSNVCQLSV